MSKRLITVTQEDIDKGVVAFSTGCPIALAIKRVFPDHFVSVGLNQISLIGNHTFNVFISERLREFISNFDVRKPVKPFKFYLRLPPGI